MMRKTIRVISFNIAMLAVGLFLLEIVWNIFYANDIRFTVNVLADTHYQFDVSSLYKTDDSVISYNRDENGFRGEYSQVEDIDIIIVGGSTTDQRYIDDKKEWCHILEENLNSYGLDVTIVNAGVDGQSSFGHIKNFDMWFPKIESLHPKYILFYVGINDFYKHDGHFYDVLASQKSTKRIIENSFLYYVARLAKGLILTKTHKIGHYSTDWQSIETTMTPLLTAGEYKSLMSSRLKEYLKRLNILVTKTKEMGAIPVFITQRTMAYWMNDGHIVGIAGASTYDDVKYNGVDMYYMNKLLNNTTMSICNDVDDVICIDLESELHFDHKDFYDTMHNTPIGYSKIGEYLASKVQTFYQ